jgi:hypothetical protein
MAGTSPAMTNKWVKPDGICSSMRDPSASVAHACVPVTGPRLMIVATILRPSLATLNSCTGFCPEELLPIRKLLKA